MRDVDTTDSWTLDDDALVRAALLSLRPDVDASPLAGPEGARSVGNVGRRRRMLGLTVGVAASVAIVAALGFRGATDEGATPPPVPAGPGPVAATSGPSTSPSPSTRPNPTPSILNRGSSDVPTTLFLTADEWTDAQVAGTHTLVSDLPPEAEEGALTSCDPNGEASPAGVAWMLDTTTSQHVGVQRIQTSNLSSDGSTNDTEPAAVVQAMLADATCSGSKDPAITIVAGPRPGTVAVTRAFADYVGTRTDYVGVVAMRGDRNTSTLVLRGQVEANSASTWAALGRVMDAAAAK